MKVDFFKQSKINQPYKESIIEAINNLIDSNYPLVNGKYIKQFEDLYADFIGCKYCAFVSNGIDALTISLQTLGLKDGDEVIVPNHTYIATWLSALD